MGDMEFDSAEDRFVSQELPRQYSEEEAAFSKWQIDPDETLERIEHTLRGERRNPKNKEWYTPKNSRPSMLPVGVSATIDKLGTIINKETALSALEEDVIYSMCRDFGLDLIDWLDAHKIEFGIDPRDLKIIVDTLMFNVLIFLMRAKDGLTIRGVQKVYTLSERTGEKAQEKGGLFSGGIFGKSKGGK